MSINFKSTAISASTLSDLMDGREKEDLIVLIASSKGKPVHITDVDIVAVTKNGPCAIFTVAEHPDKFYFGGTILTGVVRAWADAYNGDLTAMREDLRKIRDGIPVILTREKTADGNPITRANFDC